MKKRTLNTWLMFLPVLYCIVTLGFVSGSSHSRVCNAVDVCIKDSIENTFVNENDVLKILEENEYKLKGMALDLINIQDVENIINQHPSIQKSECYETADGTIKIDVFQRRPVVRIVGNKNNYYVDRNGEIMPTSRYYAAHVVVATGKISEQIAKTELFQLATYINEHPFWKSQVVQINVLYGPEFELIPRVGKHVILLGGVNDLKEKLQNVEALYKSDFNENGWNRYRKINVKFKNQVVCTKK